MHRFRSATDGGGAAFDGSSRYGREDEAEADSSVFVKYNRMLHGKKTERGRKRDTLTIKFLKKYIHYAKHRIQPELSDEASDQIATAYAELRSANSNAKTGGTLPITARTLETIIRLSTAHAKLKLSRKVEKSDVDAALKVLNFAIYHKELTEMEERELEREKELERKRKAEHDAGGNDGADDGPRTRRSTSDAMEVDDDTPAPQSAASLTPERIEAFNSLFGQHMRGNRLDVISIADIESVIKGADSSYSSQDILDLLKKLEDDNRVMIADGRVHMIS
ncbi:hypothetical protein PIB30_009139 [Stylosanthes scabra]|uniref:DNA helicase n=1 Tax=Stylosanthes scabra TaxID=79078 RepID=A0ABU6X2G1_9FABA|nr:hypothetical protein [Stylosanthes scabra]